MYVVDEERALVGATLRRARAENVRFSFVAAVNDRTVLEQCLLRSPDIRSGGAELFVCEGHKSAASALNSGIAQSTSRYIICVHQDVYLPQGWLVKLAQAIDALEACRTPWAVLGVVGKGLDGELVGSSWSTDVMREYRGRTAPVIEVKALDECVLVIDRTNQISFDEDLPHFHLYAADLILEGQKRGLKSFCIDAPVIHHSVPVRSLRGGYEAAYRYMRRKWRQALPWPTLIVPLEDSYWPVWRGEIRRFRARLARWRDARRGLALPNRAQLDPVQIAASVGYEACEAETDLRRDAA